MSEYAGVRTARLIRFENDNTCEGSSGRPGIGERGSADDDFAAVEVVGVVELGEFDERRRR